MWRWFSVTVPVSISASTAATAPVPSALPYFFEPKFGLDAAGFTLVARGHVAAVCFHHVCFQVERGVKDDELMCETVGLSAWVVIRVEVPLEALIVLEAAQKKD
jgi:hypothetical protein